MANPTMVTCTLNTWVKVAEDVTAGTVWIKDYKEFDCVAYQTYRMTGESAPTTDADAIKFDGDVMGISNSAGIDVYIKALKKTLIVRVDV